MARSVERRFFDPARAPVVAVLVVAALAVFVASLAGKRTDVLVLDVRAFMGEPWRIFTTTLVHIDVLHLAFNLLWLVRQGAPIERQLGSIRFALFAVAIGGGASLAEYALIGLGVGLSGVGYGLFAFAWVLKDDPHLAGLVDRRTATLFVVWFFFCIATTVLEVLPVANVAHGAGAALGALAASAYQRRDLARRVAASSMGLLLLGASWLGSTTFRPRVNFSAGRGQDAAHLGWKLLDARDDAGAEPFLRESVRVAPHRSDYWFNLAIDLGRLEKDEESLAAYRRARELAPDEPKRTEALAGALLAAGMKALDTGDRVRAVVHCREGASLGASREAFAACLTMAAAPVEDRPSK